MKTKKKTPDPYRLADQAIELLAKDMLSRFEKYQSALNLAKFDELNVIKETKVLYGRLDKTAREWLRMLWLYRYEEVTKWLMRQADDDIDDLVEMYMANLLDKPNAVTKYSYDAEVLRKRDRQAEAVNAAGQRSEKEYEIKKAMRLWGQMVAQYADETADASTVQAFRDAGVKQVLWHTQRDQRVCRECDELDGKVFDIDALPDKPHWRCRCWITPV